MVDVHEPAIRRRNMLAIRAANTKPELTVRSVLFCAGYRYRLGSKYRVRGKRLDGSPDLVFPGKKVVIFVNGCFWHRHLCRSFRWPATRAEWWARKLGANHARDLRQWEALVSSGWRVLVIWECSLKERYRGMNEQLLRDVVAFFEQDRLLLKEL